ncbi:unnamed protein product [Chironomus riparius]|uniref:Uncharacterized protein n=1 Tax=Chironomus riparius TaxID=315576 RepID=A0A9N9WLW2_9DIPT|nr:unnamed protein product [Chironomus riparius]
MGNKRSFNEEELNRKRELDRNRKRQKSSLLTEEQLIEKRRANLESQNNIKIFIAQGVYQGKLLKNDKIFTQNVVYKEIFNI